MSFEEDNKNFVRCSILLERCKFFETPLPEVDVIDQLPKHEQDILMSESMIDTMLKLTHQQSKVLFALQTWLCNALSNRDIIEVYENHRHDVILPIFAKPKYSELLELMGHKRKLTNRGKEEFSGYEREHIAAAFESLAKIPIYYNYTYGDLASGRQLIGVETLFHYSDYHLYPSLLMMEGLDSYYLSKPANIYTSSEGMLTKGMNIQKPSLYVYRVLEWVVLQSFFNRYKPISIAPETLSRRLGLFRYWNRGKKKQVMSYIETGFELATNMNYITNFSTTGGKKHVSYSFYPQEDTLLPKSSRTLKTNSTSTYLPSQHELKKFLLKV